MLGGPDRVGDARYERRFRADHDQITAKPGRQVGDRGPGHRVDAGLLGDSCRACVAGRACQRGDFRIGGQREAQRMLARARSDDENAHGRPA